MLGYILKTDRRLQPFGDPVGETQVLARPLETYQREALLTVCEAVRVIDSVEAIDASEFLLVEDHLFFTRHLLKKALAASEKEPGSVRFALGESYFIEEKHFLGGLDLRTDERQTPYAPLPLIHGKSPDAAGRDPESLPLCTVTIDEKKFIPDNIKLLREDMELLYALSWEGALSVNHWSHILDMNQIALMAYWHDLSPKGIAWYVAHILWGMLSRVSLNPMEIAGAVNVIGKGCQIHPTAYLAGCVLGDKVQVGPHTSLMGCYLGDGAKVEGLTDITGSVIGDAAVVSFRTKVNFAVAYPMSMISYPCLQMSVLGRRALHMGGSFPIDMKLSHGNLYDVKVKHEGKVVESGKKFLGMCVGHGAIIGTGLWLQSGIEVPNDYLIVRDRDDMVMRIPEGMEKVALSLQDGELKPFIRPKASQS